MALFRSCFSSSLCTHSNSLLTHSSVLDFFADVISKRLAIPLSQSVFFVLHFFNHLNQILDQQFFLAQLNFLIFIVLFSSFNQLLLIMRNLIFLTVCSELMTQYKMSSTVAISSQCLRNPDDPIL